MINLNPTPQEKQSHGNLAYVSEVRRAEIRAMAKPQRIATMKALDNEIKAAKEAVEKKASKPTIYRPMTALELDLARRLQGVSFRTGGGDKNFIYSLSGKTEITENQAGYLKIIAGRYRRQIA